MLYESSNIIANSIYVTDVFEADWQVCGGQHGVPLLSHHKMKEYRDTEQAGIPYSVG